MLWQRWLVTCFIPCKQYIIGFIVALARTKKARSNSYGCIVTHALLYAMLKHMSDTWE